MHNRVPFVGLVSAGLILGAGLGKASNTVVNDTGTNTTAVSLTGSANTFTLTLDGTHAGGTLTVSGGTAAISVGGTDLSTDLITNSGTINQSGTTRAIIDNFKDQTITVNNGSATNSSAIIEAATDDAIHFSKSSTNATINNYGQIFSTTGGQGIDLSGMTGNATPSLGNTTINNYTTGVIQGKANDGIQTAVNGFINNDGQIIGSGSGSDGINAGTNTGLTIVNGSAIGGDTAGTASITGAHHGISGGADVDLKDVGKGYDGAFVMSVTNNLGATITGQDGSGINIDGVDATELVTVVNSGTITGNGVTGDGDGIDVDGLVAITNNATGRIISTNANGDASEGVTVGGGTITNAGLIEGQTTGTSTYARGITLAGVDNTETNNVKTAIPIQSVYGNTTVTNTGTIKGDTESGIAVLGTTNGKHLVTINNNAGGLIEGSNTGISERGTGAASGASLNQAVIELDDTSNTYVVNESGTITQDTTATGTAVAIHGVSNTLNITGGTAVITGNIAGDTAADSTLNISPGAGNSFSYGYNISGFTVNVNYTGSAATTGTVTLSGANTYTGTTTVAGGKLVVANTTGSATGSSKVAVNGTATLGGTGIIAPGAGNGVTLAKNSTLVSGGTQSGTTAGAGLALDNTTAKGVILDASLGNATLAFSLGANHSATTMTVLGDTAKELSFASSDVFALTDLNNDPLTAFQLNQPFVLIQAGTIAGLAADNALYTGIITTGGVDANGNALNGWVTSPVDITLNGMDETGKLQLYLNNGALEVVPEPGTWAMMLGGLGVLVLFQMRRRQKL